MPEARINDEIVMLDVERGLYLNLNEVGSRIWQLIDGRAAIGDICKKLGAEYTVDAATCEREVIGLIERMRNADIVEIRG
jgi:hypothetical protein